MKIRRRKYPYRPATRPWTPRRVAAARRAVEKERNRLPLFAGEYTGTVEERMRAVDRHDIEFTAYWRASYAEWWREARRVLRRLPVDLRDRILDEWNRGPYPATPVYLLDLVRTRLRAGGLENLTSRPAGAEDLGSRQELGLPALGSSEHRTAGAPQPVSRRSGRGTL